MGAVLTKTVADLRRRRLQTAVLAVVLFLAAGAATLALSVLVATQEPFDRAFTSTNGAHLVIDYSASTTDAQLAPTRTSAPVTASAGPWPVTTAALPGKGGLIGDRVVSGRPLPDATIDLVPLSAGRWWQAPGEIVLSEDTADMLDAALGQEIGVFRQPQGLKGPRPVRDGGGSRALVPPEPDPGTPKPTPAVRLTVVGIAASVSTPDVAAWISPADVATLAEGGPAPQRQMLYRVDPSTTGADLTSATAAITASLPADAVERASTFLAIKSGVDEVAQLYVPALLAFALFALVAAAFTIANVVSGITLTRYREIGVMKAVGFTPVQVTTTLLAQILVPVTLGAVLGAVAGAIGSRPTVADTSRSFGLPGSVPPPIPVVVGVIALALAIAVAAAVVPAINAGRLSTVGAITRGTAPSRHHDGGPMRRLGLRLRAPFPVRLGIAAGLSHPGRAAMTLGALVVGVAAITFSLGLDLSLMRVMTQIDRSIASPVRVELADPDADPATIAAAIAGHPATARSVGLAQTDATAARGLGPVSFVAYDGDARWIGYELIAGRWFAGPGEAVARSSVFTRSGLQIGDTLEIAAGDRTIGVRLVGEIFDGVEAPDEYVAIRGSWQDLLALDPSARPSRWEVLPAGETSATAYAESLAQRVGSGIGVQTFDDPGIDEGFLLFLSVIASMGVVLVVISIAGVLDVVVLETRQRTREMAVLKAVGMTPRQVVAMVVASVVPVGLLAGALGVPIGLAFQRAVVAYMGQVAAETRIPESTFDVFTPLMLIGLSLAGLAIAIVGAWLPAQRAAVARIVPVLQAE
jgi:putative ABC transport system permease protein